MKTETEMLINVFKDYDLQKLKNFIFEETIKSKNFKDLSKVMYAMWLISQDRISPMVKK